MLKKILLALMFVITATTNVTYAEDDMKTVASKAYVDTKIETKQLKIPAAGQPNVGAGETVMTYTATGNGQIGERGLYSDISSYDANIDADKLITASALNATFTNLPTTPTTKLECANENDGCTLWTIVDQTAYARGLPDGYTRLQYIQSRGTQYIDTGYKLSSADEVKVKAKFIDFPDAPRSSYIFGAYGDNANFGINNNGTNNYAVWGSSSTQFTPAMVSGTIYDIDMKLGLLTINGIAASYTPSGTFTNTTKNAYLFWANGTTQPKQPVAIYSFQIINNGTVIHNLIPAKRNSDNVIGMYDTVSGNFFTNAATSGPDFTPGPPAN